MKEEWQEALRRTRELLRENRLEEAWGALPPGMPAVADQRLLLIFQLHFHQGPAAAHVEWIRRFRQTQYRRRALQVSLDFLCRPDVEEFLPEVYGLVGEHYLMLDDLDSALEFLSNSARLDPHRWETQLALGQVLTKKELHPEALEAFQVASRLTKEQNPLIHYYTSLWLDQVGQLEGGPAAHVINWWKRAAEGYQESSKSAEIPLETVPAQPVADDLTTIGRLYFELGRYEEAELEFRTILRKDLCHVPALLGLGRVCQATANWRDAALCFRRILNLESVHRIASEHLAEVYLQQNLLDEAVKNYLWAAQGYLEDGQRNQAVRIYKLVLRIDPAHPQAIRQLVQLGEQPDL